MAGRSFTFGPRCIGVASTLLAFCSVIARGGLSSADTPSEIRRNYQVIIERNPFGLRPTAPPVPATNAAVRTPETELILTGIVTLGLSRWAFFVADDRVQPPYPFGLRVGEEDRGVRVLAIHPHSKSVELLNNGEYVMLSFESHGVKDPMAVKSAEQKFVEEHVRAHERRYREERERARSENTTR